jgi:hypothetical protein
MSAAFFWVSVASFSGYYLIRKVAQKYLDHVTHETSNIGIICKCAYICGKLIEYFFNDALSLC